MKPAEPLQNIEMGNRGAVGNGWLAKEGRI